MKDVIRGRGGKSVLRIYLIDLCILGSWRGSDIRIGRWLNTRWYI